MEPADDRREHLCLSGYTSQNLTPQWSPPTIGGSTYQGVGQIQIGVKPQWSPPTISGSTCKTHADMADFPVPQWSPPTTGGAPAAAALSIGAYWPPHGAR